MTIRKFKSLSCQKQAEALWEHGTFIADRQNSRYFIMLYQIEGFYIETMYHKINESIVLKCFDATDLLQPYLDRINITALLQD